MSKIDKLRERFLSKPKDFTYDELKVLLSYYGYNEIKKGKTSGSRVAFCNKNNRMLFLHKPHPGNVIKAYIINYVIDFLKESGEIND